MFCVDSVFANRTFRVRLEALGKDGESSLVFQILFLLSQKAIKRFDGCQIIWCVHRAVLCSHDFLMTLSHDED